MTLLPRVIEKPDFVDESGDPIHRTYHFQVINTTSPALAKSLVESYFGPVISTPYGILFRSSADCQSSRYNGFDVDIEYITRQKDIGTWEWDGDGNGVMQHITHSLETVQKYPTATAKPSNRCIGRNRITGEIKGTDVLLPGGATFAVTFTHPSGVMTLQYFKYLCDLIGYVNDAPFLVWNAGEVKFAKPRCKGGSQTQSVCVYEFHIQRNRTNFAIDTITGIDKDGWDVIHVENKQTEETVGGVKWPASKPEFAWVERVAYRINFSTAFGIS